MSSKTVFRDGVSRVEFSARDTELPGVSHGTFDERLREHLREYLDLQHILVNFEIPADRMAKAYRLANEARNLAFEISMLPGYEENPILQRSNRALIDHWRSLPFNGGVLEADYRLALKSMLLFLALRERETICKTLSDRS